MQIVFFFVLMCALVINNKNADLRGHCTIYWMGPLIVPSLKMSAWL